MSDDSFQGGYGLGNFHYNLGEEMGAGNQGFAYGGNNGWSDDYSRAVAAGADPNQVTDKQGYGLRQGPSGADQATGRFQGLGAAWANRQAPQLNLDQANGYMQSGDQARQSQADALGMMQTAAQGNAPSAAAQQMAIGNADAMRAQLSAAAGARGAGAMGAAGYNAAQMGGQMTAQNVAQTGMLRAQEMAQARDAYMQGASGMRGQDYGAAGLAGGWAGQNAGLTMQQRQLGLQGQLGFEGLGNQVQEDQLNANIQKQAQMQGHWQGQSGLDQRYTEGTNPVRMISSDERIKTSVQSLSNAEDGSLERLYRGASSTLGSMRGALGGGGLASMFSDDRVKQDVAAAGRNEERQDRMPAIPAAHSRDIRIGPGDRFSWEDKPILREVFEGGHGESGAHPLGGAHMLSDARAKENASHENTVEEQEKRPLSAVMKETDADRFLDTLKPFSYQYKNLADEPTDQPMGGRYLGIMAQNVERAPTGDTIVKDTPRGKVLENGAMVSAMAAGLGRIHERMRELEGQRGKR